MSVGITSPYGEFPNKKKIAITQIEFGEELLKMLKRFQVLNSKINNAFDGDFENKCKKMQNDIEILFNLLKSVTNEGQEDLQSEIKELKKRVSKLEQYIAETVVRNTAEITATNTFKINSEFDTDRLIEVIVNGITYNDTNWSTNNGKIFNWKSTLFDLDEDDLIEVRGYLK
jgi:polyhydroxyalkanoate synthesis regulator phasin